LTKHPETCHANCKATGMPAMDIQIKAGTAGQFRQFYDMKDNLEV